MTARGPGPILAFDTSAAHCAAALVAGDAVLASRIEPMAKGQAERLLPMLEEMLGESRLAWRDLARIGVGIGPGSFTGIRIGVAAARGMALGLRIPAIGVTRLEALAWGLIRPVLVVETARQGAVHAQGFGCAPEAATRLSLDDARTLGAGGRADRVPASGPPRVAGNAASAVAASPGLVVVPTVPLAVAVARVALARAGPHPRPAPFYLREADAAPPADRPPPILDA